MGTVPKVPSVALYWAKHQITAQKWPSPAVPRTLYTVNIQHPTPAPYPGPRPPDHGQLPPDHGHRSGYLAPRPSATGRRPLAPGVPSVGAEKVGSTASCPGAPAGGQYP
jgi:hypothetical protein